LHNGFAARECVEKGRQRREEAIEQARRVALPIRTQTIAGASAALSARMVTKSSSFVISTAPLASTRAQMARSGALASPSSATCSASCPRVISSRASTGGSCASIRKRTVKSGG
jgi:hypothetical protein